MASQAANNQSVNTPSTPPSSRKFEVNTQENSVKINNKEYKVDQYGYLNLIDLTEISSAEIEALGI